MTNATPAAGTPAADPYLRWETAGRLVRPARPAHARTRAPRVSRERNGRDLAAAALLPKLDPRARAADRRGRLERLAANEPVDPNDPDGWRSRDAHAQAVLHRHGRGKLSATRLTSAAITALIDGQARPTATPDSTGAPSRRQRARSTSGWRAPTPRCPSTSTILGCGRISSISGACSPDRSGSTTIWRTTCRGGCSPTPASSTPATCAAGGSARTPGCRSPASGSGRSARSSGRSACSSCRRWDRATGGS